MNPQDWRTPRRVESSYWRSLIDMLDRYFREEPLTAAKVLAIPEWLARYARQAAERMVLGLLSLNARSWRAAAAESMQGQKVFRALREELRGPSGIRVRALVAENAKLISSLPGKVAQQVTARASEQYFSGERAKELAKTIKGVSAARARMIAVTEVSKASSALTRARAESLDLPWYVWKTSEDERVRPSHRKMSNVLVRWDHPPAPERLIGQKSSLGHYNAGNAPHDRCYGEPLITLNQVRWPHRVYVGGEIRYMTRSQFERLNVGRVAA